jgi:hypothetical protein
MNTDDTLSPSTPDDDPPAAPASAVPVAASTDPSDGPVR